MSENDVQRRVREKYGLRLGPEMAAYVLRQLQEGTLQTIPVIAGDARTGVAVRKQLPADELRQTLSGEPESASIED